LQERIGLSWSRIGSAAGPVSLVVRPQEGFGVDTADLERIEAVLGLSLPADYRELMLAYPPFLRESRYPSPVGGLASDGLLIADPDRVIAYNRNWRDDDFLLGEDDAEPRPDRYLIIGEDCGGNCWCVKLDSDDRAVWFFNHEDGSLKQSAETCAAHVESLKQLLADASEKGGG
jgi:hypothetical protein